MSTTLTNGLKLPDKGSVDWYADMQNNYTILDGAVGTVAEHTTQIAGKAASVHTHTVSQITDFPAYGNTAGTICEGNDSRLSDARTPVAHTHTKSDVTDLLNSNFIPSANNSYNLGSSSYQWNNLYAKNYYYNGTAWGLDKQNEWTNFQRMICNPAVWYLRNNAVTLGTAPSSNRYLGTFFEDVNGDSLGHISFQASKSGINSLQFNIANSDGTNAYTTQMRLRLAQDGTSAFIPETDNTIKLGDSGNHWKDCYTYLINGINPGALSLPDYNSADPIDFSQWSVPGNNAYTPTADGWLCVITKDTATSSIFVYSSNLSSASRYCGSVYGNGSQGQGRLAIMFPVRANVTYTVILSGDSVSDIYAVRFYPCQGNV